MTKTPMDAPSMARRALDISPVLWSAPYRQLHICEPISERRYE